MVFLKIRYFLPELFSSVIIIIIIIIIIIMVSCIAPFTSRTTGLIALYNIITPADLYTPEPSQLPGKHTKQAATERYSFRQAVTSRSFTVYSRVPLLHMGEVRK